ncbi:MAG: helix-turn-helix domain-containing protein [Stagnimonas sp.]|nr:helix-turn-helix domain-containing protein [Stagnimonas sp.]
MDGSLGGQPGGRISELQHDSPLGRWRLARCRPRAELAGQVAMLWYGEGSVSYQRDRILPGGGSFLLINLGPTQYRIEPGPPERRVPFQDIWYSGQHQTPIDTEAPHGNALLGVAFHAGGGYGWLEAPASACADRTLPLAELLGDCVLALREQLLNTASLERRFDRVEDWLAGRLSPRRVLHAAVRGALAQLGARQGQVRIEQLCAETGYSRKHLNSLFLQQVGQSPKTLARLQRFRAALQLLGGVAQVPWAELAEHCGYYDQSHLIRDFRAFSGYAPGEFLRQGQPDAGSVVVR